MKNAIELSEKLLELLYTQDDYFLTIEKINSIFGISSTYEHPHEIIDLQLHAETIKYCQTDIECNEDGDIVSCTDGYKLEPYGRYKVHQKMETRSKEATEKIWRLIPIVISTIALFISLL